MAQRGGRGQAAQDMLVTELVKKGNYRVFLNWDRPEK
jgi:hypothetical protein